MPDNAPAKSNPGCFGMLESSKVRFFGKVKKEAVYLYKLLIFSEHNYLWQEPASKSDD